MNATLAPAASVPAQAGTALPHVDDAQLAQALQQARAVAGAKHEVLVVANAFQARAAVRPVGGAWTEVGQGDVGDITKPILSAAAKLKQLFWLNTGTALPGTADIREPAVMKLATSATAKDVAAWLKNAAKVSQVSGRKGEVSEPTRFEVASKAAWRCQFEGCGQDLRAHFAPGASGNYSYFAHIVASSIDGPRGDANESAKLADDPTNIMLMCDRCHRLIDRVAPDEYDTPRLRAMRAANVAEVSRLLDVLTFPKARMVVIGGNIEGQSFLFDQRTAEEAMWLQSMRQADAQAQFFARNGGHLGAVNSDSYWGSLFKLLQTTDIPRFKAIREGTASDGPTSLPIAVFPLHSMSVLVLAGRLVGDSGVTHLFQFHRDQVSGTPGAQWAWPNNPKPAADKFKVKVHRAAIAGEQDAVLQLNLTARPKQTDLPTHIFSGGTYGMPAIEITVDDLSHRVIGHPHDLELLGRAIDAALAKMQDDWGIRRIHLIPVAPPTACVRFGQKLQARHHADVVIYERRPSTVQGQQGEFGTTIEISSTKVTLLSTGESASIS